MIVKFNRKFISNIRRARVKNHWVMQNKIINKKMVMEEEI